MNFFLYINRKIILIICLIIFVFFISFILFKQFSLYDNSINKTISGLVHNNYFYFYNSKGFVNKEVHEHKKRGSLDLRIFYTRYNKNNSIAQTKCEKFYWYSLRLRSLPCISDDCTLIRLEQNIFQLIFSKIMTSILNNIINYVT